MYPVFVTYQVCVGHAGSGHRAKLHLGIVSGSVEVVREAQGGSMVGNLVPLIYPIAIDLHQVWFPWEINGVEPGSLNRW